MSHWWNKSDFLRFFLRPFDLYQLKHDWKFEAAGPKITIDLQRDHLQLKIAIYKMLSLAY